MNDPEWGSRCIFTFLSKHGCVYERIPAFLLSNILILKIVQTIEELEYPEYKNQPDTTGMVMGGTESITPISYSYGSLGLAFELIYKTFTISDFKPLYTGRKGHKLEGIHQGLNPTTQTTIENYARELESCFKMPYISDMDIETIINQIDDMMVNANVKYNNIPQKEDSGSKISKQASFKAFGYNRTHAIIRFMREISEVAYNMLGLSQHIITNIERVCPGLSESNKAHKKLIFDKCSEFISDFEIKIQNEKILITSPETTINRLYPTGLSVIGTRGLHNPFNHRCMNFVAKGRENAGKEIIAGLKELGIL